MRIDEYFEILEEGVENAHYTAKLARERGVDPDLQPEIPLTIDLAERVESLVGPPGIAEKIRKAVKELGRDEAALQIAKEISISSNLPEEESAEQALRTALAILTEGIVAAPLEGIVKVAIRENFDRSKYLAVYFAGPIRSAGGSAQALAVLTADYIRLSMGLSGYVPNTEEIERLVEETDLYNQEAARLQYLPKAVEVRKAVANIPIEITGEGTERVEVSGYRDLQRIETNQLRGGAVLVLAEGVLQKAQKIAKYVNKLKIGGWDWISNVKEKKGVESLEQKNASEAFIKDVIAGRPILSHPSAKGGLRLRYGRSRCSGLAGASINPSSMIIFDEFIATGTQIKTEKPGKGAVVSPCDSIEGPIVKLLDGSVVRVEDEEMARKIVDHVDEVLFSGDLLIGFGEFIENNHKLLPSGYCEEWWIHEARKKGYKKDIDYIPDPDEAISLCKTGIPLHPRYTYFFHDLKKNELKKLAEWLAKGRLEGDSLILEPSEDKRFLEVLGVPHKVVEKKIIIKEHLPLLSVMGLKDLKIDRFLDVYTSNDSVMEIVNSFGIVVREKSPVYIGARMGRPEKAKPRKMAPPVNLLFPLGQYGGRTRDLKKAVERSPITVEVVKRQCVKCKLVTVKLTCPRCSNITNFYGAYEKRSIDIKRLYQEAVDIVGETEKVVKGVVGLSSPYKIPEPLEKGILRAKNDVFVFKDGTSRFDCTDMPLTHFRPHEINTSVERLRELGYSKDVDGAPLTDSDQIVEMLPQDIVIPKEGLEYLTKVSRFIDELLQDVYQMEPFYSADNYVDLVGTLVVGLAPHTSAGILARIIGYTECRVCFGHPFFHAAKRRNCDGDEDSLILLLDALINFSRSYLPKSRGGRMDAPLVLTTRINPREIDDEAHSIDVMDSYPLEFFEKTLTFASPGDLRDIIEIAGDRLDSAYPFSSRFTHDTASISMGPKISRYLSLGEMREKVSRQLDLAGRIRAVDRVDVAKKVIESHFLPDLAGNLKAFSKQSIRCVACNSKYRRAPLSGTCRKCGGKLVLTVSKGSIEKYLGLTKEMVYEYGLDDYIKQRIEILERSIDSVFQEEPDGQISLVDYL